MNSVVVTQYWKSSGPEMAGAAMKRGLSFPWGRVDGCGEAAKQEEIYSPSLLSLKLLVR